MKRLSHEEFIELIKDINNKIDFLSEYKGSHKKIHCKCKDCGKDWWAMPVNLRRGSRCPFCFREKLFADRRLSQEEFKERLKKNYPTIMALGEYKGQDSYVLCRCEKCKKEFNVWAGSILLGRIKELCPDCREDVRPTRLSPEEFSNRVESINPDLEVVGQFTTIREKVLMRCKKCGNNFEIRPNLLLSHHCGCPVCAESKGERRITLFLEKNNVKYFRQYKFENCKDKKCLPFDFYLPDYNICIEYDGSQHYIASDYLGGQKKLEYTQKHDKIKTDFCKKENINLIRIPYYNYSKIEEILQEVLKVGDAE